jgi:purine nucleoside permease
VLIAGIAGIDPSMGTLGSAAWARYLVDFGLRNEIDASEKPANWTTGYLGSMQRIRARNPSWLTRRRSFSSTNNSFRRP